MKKVRLIIKGILLWFTAFVVLLSICGIDSISDKGFVWLLGTVVLDAMLILTCIKTTAKEEYSIISGYNWFESTLNID